MPFSDDDYPHTLIRRWQSSGVLGSFTHSFPKPRVICKSLHYSGRYYQSLLILRETWFVHPKQLRSLCCPQNRCTSCWFTKEDKVLATRNVWVPGPSLHQEHTSVSWTLPLGKVGHIFWLLPSTPPPRESFLPCLRAASWSCSPVFRKLPISRENELMCCIVVWALYLLIHPWLCVLFRKIETIVTLRQRAS